MGILKAFLVSLKLLSGDWTKNNNTCCLGLSCLNVLKDGFSGKHPALHSIVGALDLRHVHEAGPAANQATPREGQLRDALQATLIEGPRAVAARNTW